MTKKKRYYDIDWLRVLGMLTIFLFHNARFFNAVLPITTASGLHPGSLVHPGGYLALCLEEERTLNYHDLISIFGGFRWV